MHWREHQQRIRRSSTSLLIFAILSMNHTVWGINSAQFGLVWRRFVVICVFSSYRGHNLGWTFELLWARDYILTALAKSLWADAWASLKSLFGVRNVLSDWKFWKILVFGSKFGLRIANMFANTGWFGGPWAAQAGLRNDTDQPWCNQIFLVLWNKKDIW